MIVGSLLDIRAILTKIDEVDVLSGISVGGCGGASSVEVVLVGLLPSLACTNPKLEAVAMLIPQMLSKKYKTN